MNKASLISIEHLSQLIPALAALKHKQPKSQEQVLVFTKPHIVLSEIKIQHIQALLKNVNALLIQGQQLIKNPRLSTYLPVRLRRRLLREIFKNYQIKALYFAHDLSSDFWNQALMQALPQARRICYGDALGLVYSQDYFTQFMYGLRSKNKILLHNLLARIKRSLIYPSKKNRLFAEEAVLAIPCDPSRTFFKQCSLSIIDPEKFKHQVAELAANLPDFKHHLEDLVTQGSRSCHLLMLNGFTESKMTSLTNELLLYKDILKQQVHPEDLVIIKPHPAQRPENLSYLLKGLEKEYQIKVIDPAFYHLPIELAEILVKNCNILSLSYSSISLSYLYHQQVTHVLTQKLIDKYFLTEKIAWFIESNALYLKMVEALQSWKHDCELLIE